MPNSQNGWPVLDINQTKVWSIPGSERRIRLESGDAGFLLVHFAERFNEYVEPLYPGELDDWGYNRRKIGNTNVWSNHASGTAEDLNALQHPQGVRGTFDRDEVDIIRALLDEYDECIAWGGDYVHLADEMHYEIVGSKAEVAAVAAKLRSKAVALEQKIDKLTDLVNELITTMAAHIHTMQPAIRNSRIALDYRHHHMGSKDDFVGQILSIRNGVEELRTQQKS